MPDTLCMADGVQVKTLEELREHFDLISVLEHYTSGKLLEWLENLHCAKEASAVAAMNPFMNEFEKALCALLGVPFSLDEMMHIYEKAARENNAEAQFRYGCCYMSFYGIIYSRGVKSITRNHKKYLKGVEWTRRAAEQGHPFAQYSLGNFYRHDTRQRNEEEARIWYQKAADQGYIEAQYSLGTLESCQKAAERGHIRAKVRIGNILHGKGGAQNDHEAAKWYHRAFLKGEHWRITNKLDLCLALMTDAELAYKHDEPLKTMRGVLGQQYMEQTALIANRDYNANVTMLLGNDQICPAYMCYIPEGNRENDMEVLWRCRMG